MEENTPHARGDSSPGGRGRAWSWSSLLRRITVVSSAAALALTSSLLSGPIAQADSAPVNPADPATPTTVTADALPTVQVDGVVWQQLVVGDTVYVAGSFTTARPAGSAPGQNTVPRNNLLAYNIRTGQLIDSWAPSLNAQAYALAASPDGKRIYVGGQFTAVNGATVWRVAVFDAVTGRIQLNFLPKMDASVRAIVVTNDTVYLGGIFSGVGGVARSRLAAFSPTDGSLKPWAPTTDSGQVNALAVSPDRTKVVVGGSFMQLNGSSNPGYGLGAVDAVTGALLPFPINNVVRNGNTNGSITSLSSNGTNVYGSGYTFGRSSTLEGIFSVRWSDFSTEWIQDCHGDTYSTAPIGDVIYAAGHSHYCGNVGGFPQKPTWDFQRTLAFSRTAVGTLTQETYGYTNYEGTPAPALLNWFPYMLDGTYTGQNQGPWSVAGTSEYVVFGGEFPVVNGVGQQGLVRFTTRDKAANQRGPKVTGSLFNPTLISTKTGEVRVRWQANWDEDNSNLTYQVVRDANTVHTVQQESTFWRRPGMTFVDRGLVPGQTYGYRVFATDPTGNIVRSDTVTITAATSDRPQSAYEKTVLADSPGNYWRLGESSRPTGFDSTGPDDLRALEGASFGAAGGISGDENTAAALSGALGGQLYDPTLALRPNTFSTEAWFKTTTTIGGAILSYGNGMDVPSTDVDRVVYMANDGRLFFGAAPGGSKRTVGTTTRYNDGAWHHVVATLGGDGMRLYVDGVLLASRTDTTTARPFDAYWKIGGDNLSGYTSRPTSRYFSGSVDEVAIYSKVLSPDAIARHYSVGKGTAVNLAPIADFSSTASDLTVSVNGSASADPDGSISSYAWDFGDGGTGSGPTASHTYATGGTFPVKLTVTDDRGATGSVTKQITVVAPPPNAPPAPSFTATMTDLRVAVDGRASRDSDGTITSYAWDFGDGGTATGSTASYTYRAPGTYTVTLRVTDDDGATAASTRQVTATAPTAGTVLASDSFGRTLASGWGSADTGGAWTLSGSSTLFSTSGGQGSIRMGTAGSGPAAYLTSVLSSKAESAVKVRWDKISNGGGLFAYIVGRRVGTAEYRAKVWVSSTGAMTLDITKVVNGTMTTLASRSVGGVTYAAGDQLQVRFQASGTSPTTLNAKVWKVGTTEPTAWTTTVTDNDGALQSAGSVGLMVYLSGSSTVAPVVASFDDYTVTALP